MLLSVFVDRAGHIFKHSLVIACSVKLGLEVASQMGGTSPKHASRRTLDYGSGIDC